jgi:hypothetical protein
VVDAQALRDELRREGVDVADLDRILADLKELERNRAVSDRDALDKLQQGIIAGLKEFEFGLRRKFEGEDKEKVLLNGSDQVPPAYRKMVEEYYRSLSSGKKKN